MSCRWNSLGRGHRILPQEIATLKVAQRCPNDAPSQKNGRGWKRWTGTRDRTLGIFSSKPFRVAVVPQLFILQEASTSFRVAFQSSLFTSQLGVRRYHLRAALQPKTLFVKQCRLP